MILHRFGLSAPAFVCCCLSSRVPSRVLSQSNQVPTSYIKDLNLLLLSSSSSSSRQFFQLSFSSSLSAHLHLHRVNSFSFHSRLPSLLIFIFIASILSAFILVFPLCSSSSSSRQFFQLSFSSSLFAALYLPSFLFTAASWNPGSFLNLCCLHSYCTLPYLVGSLINLSYIANMNHL
jgi:hypothetical protein